MFEFEESYGRSIRIAVEGIKASNEKIAAQNAEIHRLEQRIDVLSACQVVTEGKTRMLEQQVRWG